MALIKRAINEESKTPLGIPEYFNDRGIGKYFYLTGSATWLLKVIKEDLFGIKMKAGKCFLEPKLLKTDFNNGKATLKTKMFTGETLFIYENEKGLEYGNYNIKLIADGKEIKNGFDKHYNTIQVICY